MAALMRSIVVAVIVLGLSLACRPQAPPAPPATDERPASGGDLVVAAPGSEAEEDVVPPSPPPVVLAQVHEVDDSMTDLVVGERVRIPIAEHDNWLGAREPTVVVVMFFDYQCPYCRKLMATMYELAERYPDDVRIVLKFNPLKFHEHAESAARAAVAAQRQGRFWAMHDELFLQSPKLDEQQILDTAGRIGLSLGTFREDWNDPKAGERVEVDLSLGREVKVTGVPAFYVNGRAYSGASPIDTIAKVVDEEVTTAAKLIERGAERRELYARFQKAAGVTAKHAPARPPQPGRPDPAAHYAVPTGGRAARGPDDALVTIIEFADYQCPFSNRVRDTLEKLQAKHPDDVRLVFRNLPLPFHNRARPAAIAALAADRQGKFWKLHERLFDNQKTLSDKDIERLAKKAGLKMKRFRNDIADPALEKLVEADEAAAKRFAVRGTPAFFVNGRFLSGAQPLEKFEAVVAEELARAKEFRNEHKIPAGSFYDTLIVDFEPEVTQ